MAITVIESACELPLIARLVRLRLQYHCFDDFEVIWLDFVFFYDHVLDWLQCLPALVFGFRFEGIWKTEINCSLEFPISDEFSYDEGLCVGFQGGGGWWELSGNKRQVSCDLFRSSRKFRLTFHFKRFTIKPIRNCEVKSDSPVKKAIVSVSDRWKTPKCLPSHGWRRQPVFPKFCVPTSHTPPTPLSPGSSTLRVFPYQKPLRQPADK